MSTEIEIPTCDTCPYWDPTVDSAQSRACVRQAPQMVALANEPERGIAKGDAQWPYTDHDFTCGDHPEYPTYVEELADRLAVAKHKRQKLELIEAAKQAKGAKTVEEGEEK